MADIYIDVDVALTELPVNKLPLVAKSDGITINAAVAYNAAGMDLNWNFIASNGSYTHTNVIPTTAGAHDWVAAGNGIYTIEIPTAAGTINNDTEGYGWFTGETTAEAPWCSPIYCFRAATLNDAYCDGGDLPDVNVTHITDVAQTGNDNGADINTMVSGIITGAAETGTLSPTQATTNLVGYNNNQLIGRVITWLSGSAIGESAPIYDYVSTNGLITFKSLTTTPSNTDTFKIT